MSLVARANCTCSAARAWEVVSDVTRWPDRLSTFDAIDEIGRPADGNVGRRFVVRQPGLPATRYEITEWTEGSSFTWVARSPGVRTTAKHLITPQGTGCSLTLTVDWTGPLAPWVRRLVRAKTQRFIDIEATTLTRVADTGE